MGATPLLTVLTYHRVEDSAAGDGLDPALVSASPYEFERQVRWLAAATTPLTLSELLEVRWGRARLPDRAVLVTFDDAYRDFARRAWPVLRRHGVPVTLFVPTSYAGGTGDGFWWDRLHHALAHTRRRDSLWTPVGRLTLATPQERTQAARLLVAWVKRTPHDDAMVAIERIVRELGDVEPASPVLGWPELRRLAAEGVTLAPHSRTHARLDRLPIERARDEIVGSRDDLVRETGTCPPAFAFPGGGYDDGVVRLLAREGFQLAFTTRRGANDLSRADWLRLRRTNVGRRSTLPVIRAQLSSWPARVMTLAWERSA